MKVLSHSSWPQRRIVMLSLLFLAVSMAFAQSAEVHCRPEDREIFTRIMNGQEVLHAYPIGKRMVAVGSEFLETPYVASTLEVDPSEKLVVNFRGLDCTTFVENVLVMSVNIQKGKTDWESYLNGLERARYRDGLRQGYTSRLHYFSDWIYDNAQKGILEDITQSLGGLPEGKSIDFMGTHPELYPALSSKAQLEKIRKVEASISGRGFYVLPRDLVGVREHMIRDGDIIALATQIPGLDVTHTGIAIKQDDGRIHLLHASTEGRVKVSEEPLAKYLQGIKGNTGILVVRPLEQE